MNVKCFNCTNRNGCRGCMYATEKAQKRETAFSTASAVPTVTEKHPFTKTYTNGKHVTGVMRF